MSQPVATTSSILSRIVQPEWLVGLREDYEKIFVTAWSPYLGAILLVMVTVALMINGLFWGVFGGVKLWGDYFNNFVGLGSVFGIKQELESPLLHRISLMNINLVLGAFSAALLAGQFSFKRPPKLEYIWAALGGIFMGMGASLAGGCTTGGFFTPLMFASPAGWAMWAGLLVGAFIGLKLLMWTMENISWGTRAPTSAPIALFGKLAPLVGVLIFGLVIYWASTWFVAEDKRLVSRAIIILAGFGLGFILNRSRFCLSRVFREPFMTGDGTMTKAMILALALGIPVASLLLQHNTMDPYLAVPATFWLGSILGGMIFGIGMIFAGGCASGSLWRVGEGQLKLLVTVFFFGWSGSVIRPILNRWNLLTPEFDLDVLDGMVEITKVGYQAYIPDLLGGWGQAYLISFGILIIWYLLVSYNESTSKFTVL